MMKQIIIIFAFLALILCRSAVRSSSSYGVMDFREKEEKIGFELGEDGNEVHRLYIVVPGKPGETKCVEVMLMMHENEDASSLQRKVPVKLQCFQVKPAYVNDTAITTATVGVYIDDLREGLYKVFIFDRRPSKSLDSGMGLTQIYTKSLVVYRDKLPHLDISSYHQFILPFNSPATINAQIDYRMIAKMGTNLTYEMVHLCIVYQGSTDCLPSGTSFLMHNIGARNEPHEIEVYLKEDPAKEQTLGVPAYAQQFVQKKRTKRIELDIVRFEDNLPEMADKYGVNSSYEFALTETVVNQGDGVPQSAMRYTSEPDPVHKAGFTFSISNGTHRGIYARLEACFTMVLIDDNVGGLVRGSNEEVNIDIIREQARAKEQEGCDEAMEKGDWSDYKKNFPQIMASCVPLGNLPDPQLTSLDITLAYPGIFLIRGLLRDIENKDVFYDRRTGFPNQGIEVVVVALKKRELIPTYDYQRVRVWHTIPQGLETQLPLSDNNTDEEETDGSNSGSAKYRQARIPVPWSLQLPMPEPQCKFFFRVQVKPTTKVKELMQDAAKQCNDQVSWHCFELKEVFMAANKTTYNKNEGVVNVTNVDLDGSTFVTTALSVEDTAITADLFNRKLALFIKPACT